VVEPTGAAVLRGGEVTAPNHPIQGGGYSKPTLPLLDGAIVHGFVEVTGDEAADAARLLAREEGIFGGYSTGANLAAALRLLTAGERGSTIVFLVCDSGLKYLSTDLYPVDPTAGGRDDRVR
jgi:cysteine synthase A